MRRCKAEVERTRQRLLEAAERVFSDRGYAVARLEDIADVAGLTRGSIYWHFQGKPDLLDAVIDRTWFPWDQLPVDSAHLQPVPNIQEMAGVLGQGIQRTLLEPQLRRSASILLQVRELRSVSERVLLRLKGMQRRIERYVALVIEQAWAGDPGRCDGNATARVIGTYLFGALSQALLLCGPGEQHQFGQDVERFILALLSPLPVAGQEGRWTC